MGQELSNEKKFDSLACLLLEFRITSYNVCYTKLLRALEPARSVALILAFGYRLNAQSEHLRHPLSVIVERRYVFQEQALNQPVG